MIEEKQKIVKLKNQLRLTQSEVAVKADLADVDTDLSSKADKTNVLELNNTTVFTPDADYEPATKKYVDDSAGGAPGGGTPTVATGAEVDTGTDNTKMVTPKAMEDSSYAKTAAIPVKASTSEVNAGTDDAKFVTSAALYGSSYLDNVKATSLTDISDAEIDLDNHSLILIDANDSTIKKITFANLKKYLDTLYTPL